MEHSLEEKLNVIKMHKQGAGVKLLAKRFGLSRSLITVWLEQYKQHGVAGLQRLPYNCRYNFEEKCHIVCEIEKKHVPLHVVSAKYRVARSTLRCWRYIVRRDGYEALREVKYGRKYASMGRQKKKEPVTELEKLQKRRNELSAALPKKSIIPILITNNSAKHNEYYNQLIYNNITLKNLFL